MNVLHLFLLFAGVISTELFSMGGFSSSTALSSLSITVRMKEMEAEERERQRVDAEAKRIQQDLAPWVTTEREKAPEVKPYNDDDISTIVRSLFDYGMTLVDQEKQSTQETILKKDERYRNLLEETRPEEREEYSWYFSGRFRPVLTRLNTIDPYCVRFFDVCTHKEAQLGEYDAHIQEYIKKNVLCSVRKAHEPCCCCCSIL